MAKRKYAKNRFHGRPAHRRLKPDGRRNPRPYVYKEGVRPGPKPIPIEEKIDVRIVRRRGRRPELRAFNKKTGKDMTKKVSSAIMRKQMNESMEELLLKIPLDDMEANLIFHYGNPYMTAAALGISWTTVYRYLMRFPELRRAQELGKEAIADYAEAKNIEAIEKGVNSNVLFTLRTLGKNRGYSWDKEERIERKRQVKVVSPSQRPEIQDVEVDDE